jgi:hypothetical protein
VCAWEEAHACTGAGEQMHTLIEEAKELGVHERSEEGEGSEDNHEGDHVRHRLIDDGHKAVEGGNEGTLVEQADGEEHLGEHDPEGPCG